MSDLRVANTILEQLGGAQFIVMTGSKNFVGDDNSLTMRLARNKSKANMLKITLTPMDDYTVEFYRYTSAHFTRNYNWIDEKRVTVKKLDGVYFDQLQRIFEDVTGLYTRIR